MHAELEVAVPVRPRDVEVHEWDPDTDSTGGVRCGSGRRSRSDSSRIELEPRIRAFASLDPINLVEVFNLQAGVMQSVPRML